MFQKPACDDRYRKHDLIANRLKHDKDKHGKLPLEDGIDVISVGSLAFKRFLEIAALLKLNVCIVTDNDGNVKAMDEKYADYMNGEDKINGYFLREIVDRKPSRPLRREAPSADGLHLLRLIYGIIYAMGDK